MTLPTPVQEMIERLRSAKTVGFDADGKRTLGVVTLQDLADADLLQSLAQELEEAKDLIAGLLGLQTLTTHAISSEMQEIIAMNHRTVDARAFLARDTEKKE